MMNNEGREQFFIEGRWQDMNDLRSNYSNRYAFWSNKKQMSFTLKPIKLRRYEGISEGDIITIRSKYLPYPKSKVIQSTHFIYYFDDGTKAYNTTVMTKSGNKYSTFEEEIIDVKKVKKNRKKS